MLRTSNCNLRKIILPRFHVDHFTECARKLQVHFSCELRGDKHRFELLLHAFFSLSIMPKRTRDDEVKSIFPILLTALETAS